MTLGEKLQQLRKSKSMSQEQLATQLTVSRQAISKWELGESMPDTHNIIQLSKLFEVSTDYLLHDEIENRTIIPSNETYNVRRPKQKLTSMISKLCIGCETIALILAFLFMLDWNMKMGEFYLILDEKGFKVGVCFIIQLIAIVLFEVLSYKEALEDKYVNIKKIFYIVSVWLLMPIPLTFMGFYFFPIIRRPITFLSDMLYLLIPYIVIGVTATFFVKVKKSKV